MNLVSCLRRRRRSKNTRIESGLVRVKNFASGTSSLHVSMFYLFFISLDLMH